LGKESRVGVFIRLYPLGGFLRDGQENQGAEEYGEKKAEKKKAREGREEKETLATLCST